MLWKDDNEWVKKCEVESVIPTVRCKRTWKDVVLGESNMKMTCKMLCRASNGED